MTGVKTNECVQMLKALADETRWRIVRELLLEPRTVTDLVERLSVSQYNVSKHLRILREAGIIQTQRRGRHVSCDVVPAFRMKLCEHRNELHLGCCTFRFDEDMK